MKLEDIQLGTRVRRKPAGRWCSIVAVDADAGKIKIRDGSFWCGWITADTFDRRWTTE